MEFKYFAIVKTLQISVAEFKQSLLLHLILILCFNSNRYLEYNFKLNFYINFFFCWLKKNYFEANKQSNFGTITNINTNIYITLSPQMGKLYKKKEIVVLLKIVRELIYLIFSFFRYVCSLLSFKQNDFFITSSILMCKVTLYVQPR